MNNSSRFRWLIPGLAAAFLVVALLLIIVTQLWGTLPGHDELRDIQQARSSILLSDDGEEIGSFYTQNRSTVTLDQLSPYLIDAVIAIEDSRFYSHGGIDQRALARVLVRSILLQQNAGGGSTITQQLAKNLYPRTCGRGIGIVSDKLREMIIAVRMERLYSKEEILQLYLNTVSFGEDTYGIEAASRRFFNKPAHALELEEAAMLAGLLRAPGALNPRQRPERAIVRRNVVLNRMVDIGMITPERGREASERPLELDYNRSADRHGQAPHFREQVRKELESLFTTIHANGGAAYNLHTDGLIIQTTLDSRHQKEAVKALTGHIDESTQNLDPDTLSSLEGSFVAIDPETGHVKAWIGSRNYGRMQFDHVISRRQTGSAFKPILYATAIEQGAEPCDYLRNRLSKYEAWDEWTPRNVSGEYGGRWSLQGSLAHSINTIAVELLLETGIEETRHQAERFGLGSIPDQPSIALGTAESSLLEMVSAYATFVAGGQQVTPQLIRAVYDSEGELIHEFENPNLEERTQVISARTAAIMISMLEKSVNEGTARPIRTQFGVTSAVAGKTGTTQGFTDGWFIGMTPDLAFGVWTGHSQGAPGFPVQLGYASQSTLPVAGRWLARIEQHPVESESVSREFPGQQFISQLHRSCPDFREDSTMDRLRNFFTGENSDEPRVVREERERRGFRDRVRSLFNRD